MLIFTVLAHNIDDGDGDGDDMHDDVYYLAPRLIFPGWVGYVMSWSFLALTSYVICLRQFSVSAASA